ncbi:MAG TPA: type I-U CRISPR-associated RAMP protein Csb1/Cas7u [Streptosporangiaceae bacterium]|nr:type I-U CRISPR-associated RAMP protein Csb1/Cas7u [Streptosporangiaceae bacterium]
MSMTYDELRAGVAGDAVGVRCRTVLEPLGGRADKVFPPTYSVADSAETKYAIEKRHIPSPDGRGGEVAQSVVLDSVASQANRLELTLLDAIRRGDLVAPVTSVDFRPIADLAGFDRISDYEASHRIFDALLRDSYDGENLFRNGVAGRAITEARPRDAAGLYHHSPHTLLFGGWDSTGPRGGLGAKYERAITSEIVAIGIEPGVKTASRIDAVGTELRAGPLYQAADGTWTLDESEAVRDGAGKPKLLGAKEGAKEKESGRQPTREAGRPSQANLGNVTPSIDTKSGGVTAREIFGTTVLSYIQLRRLRFPTRPDRTPFEERERREAELAARTVLAALGLTATVLAFEEGFDLRSRCVLVATGPAAFEYVTRDGKRIPFDLSGADALKLVAEAVDHATVAGISWRAEELLLRPADRLVQLIRRSQQLAFTGEAEGK